MEIRWRLAFNVDLTGIVFVGNDREVFYDKVATRLPSVLIKEVDVRFNFDLRHIAKNNMVFCYLFDLGLYSVKVVSSSGHFCNGEVFHG